jgi:N-acetylmuramoyl-L-alanine amidase
MTIAAGGLLVGPVPTAGAAAPSPRVDLRSIATKYGFSSFTASDTAASLRGSAASVVFKSDSREIRFNGVSIWLCSGVAKTPAGWTLDEVDVTRTLDPLLRPREPLSVCETALVVLDPGHGGDDTGAISPHGVYEKKLTLDLAKRVRGRLEAAGIPVRLTRDRDRRLTLSDRTGLARKWNADLYVSIHINSAANPASSGFETYLLPPAGTSSTSGSVKNNGFQVGNRYDRANMILAYLVQREVLRQAGGADRGVRRARFEVLSNAPCPAVLVECGFLSNGREETRLLTREHRETLSGSIAQGILSYLARVKAAKKR